MTASPGAPVRREARRPAITIAKGVRLILLPGLPTRESFEMLEPYEGKLSRTVLRGGGAERLRPHSVRSGEGL